MGARHMTIEETIAVNELLKVHLTINNDGTCVYADGYDDSRISAMVATDLPASSVARVRTKMFGKLFIRSTEADTIARLTENLAQVSEKLTKFDELRVKYDKLVETLSLTRIANVRHLALSA